MIAKLCKSQTVPVEFYECLEMYSKEGLRAIGIASRELTKEQIGLSEEELEKDFDFEGLLHRITGQKINTQIQ